MSRNAEVAALLYEIAEILELQGVAFKPRAYQRAAQNLEALGEDVAKVAAEGRLSEIPGVGDAIAEKVTEFLGTGSLRYLEKLRKEVPAGLLELLKVPGLGPKKAMRLHGELGVRSAEELRKAAEAGRVRALPGFGERSEQEILKALARRASLPTRFPFGVALDAAEDLIRALEATGKAERVVAAGSLRRGKDTVGDVDLLAVAKGRDAAALMASFVGAPAVVDVIAHGHTKSSVRLRGGLQADLRVLEPRHFGAALAYFTGSKEHNVALRALAQKKGYTLSEYALARVKGKKPVESGSEEAIHRRLGLQFIPPEVRENRGEIELAARKRLPRLVAVEELRADLHTHTTESDGHASAREMVAEAARRGYTAYGVSDHSAGLGVARGLDGKRLAKQRKALAAMGEEFPKVTILQGCEVNIKRDGSLDLTREARSALDYVVGSVHSSFTLAAKEQTARLLAAVAAGIDVLGHPTGRLLGERPSIEFDHEKVFEACAEAGVALELNGQPSRLDLWGDLVRTAREAGCRFAIDSDAHTVADLRFSAHGVTQARRGMLTAKEVVTTYAPQDLQKCLGHARRR